MPAIGGFRPPLTVPQQQMQLADSLKQQLKKLDGQIARAQTALNQQVKLMTVARFTPEGYKAAQAQLEKLKTNLAELQKKRAQVNAAQFAIG